ncbi:hypothetical protein JW979_07320 [bacterium]|nr:hypothetical protein [candidate division CSSED10-310 bacterium]
MDRVFIIGGVILSIIVSKIHKVIGGIVAVIVTTGILLWGLFVYGSGGTMALFDIELNILVFLLLIAIWFGFDIKQIVDGIKEGQFAKALSTNLRSKISAGIPMREAMTQTLSEITTMQPVIRDTALGILKEKPFKATIEELSATLKGNRGAAVIVYKQAVDVLNELQQLVQKFAEKDGINLPQDASTKFRLPALQVSKTKQLSFSKFLKGDIIFAYNQQMIETEEELHMAMQTTMPENKIPVDLIRFDSNNQRWSAKTVNVKGGKLPLDDISAIV